MSERLLLTDDVSKIRGIGGKKKQLLASTGIDTIGDLLDYYPAKYKDKQRLEDAAHASEERASLVAGELIRMQVRTISGRRTMLECMLRDETAVFSVVFFNMPFLRKTLNIGTEYVVFGRMKLRKGLRVWTNPEMCILGSERDTRGIIPVYRCASGISNVNMSKWVAEALNNTDLSEEWIDGTILEERRICSRDFALHNIHYPGSEQKYKQARYRIIYEKLLEYQLAIRINRNNLDSSRDDASVPAVDIKPFIESLPFVLTDGQIKCIREIEADLEREKPMNRLVQGDVGCGKTVVAEAAMWKCAASGLQSAMMAPTEILARQHYERLSADFGVYGLRTALLISGMKTSERREIISGISKGTIDIVVGTHAIIQKDVEFNNLALVITDEQHRFGVNQRKSLAKKGRGINVCVMSATPIPRTLASTVFGDMDFSIIRSKPADRIPVITRALDRSGRERAYSDARKELEAGNLVYVIAPSIDSDDEDIASVNRLYEEICGKFKEYRAELLHGRLSKEEKEKIMAGFSSGNTQILVATIVIEVGIDVPDATMIIIENAERFGLAQLHQLRGRVGRSDKQSYCYLLSYTNSETAVRRARAMVETSDGFEISEKDYELRGPGDVMGTMQSGNYSRNILALCSHADILEAAIIDADRIMVDPGRTELRHIEEYMTEHTGNDNSDII